METPTLTTDRLILRALRLEDAKEIQKNFPHWEVVKHMAATVPWPYPEDGALDFLQNVALPGSAEREEHHWAITERSDPASTHIGSITLYPRGERDSRGFWLAQRHQGKGYMKEAVVAVNDWAFDVLGMPRMLLNNAVANPASRRMKELSGAEVIEHYEHDCVAGKLPAERWLLTAETWRANRFRFNRQP